MLKTIGMLDLRKRPGQVLDEAFYKKSRFLIKRNQRPMAALIPYEDFVRYFEDEDVEIYTKERIKEFEKADKLTPKIKAKIKKFFNLNA